MTTVPTTFDDARVAVAVHVTPLWRLTPGTMYVAPWGYEDATAWAVVVNTREALVDGDEDAMLLDAPMWLVSKATGEVERLPIPEGFARLDQMTPTGTGEPAELWRRVEVPGMDSTFAEVRDTPSS
jgi:hypothetical protein